MAIIRNERAQRPDPEPRVENQPEEEEIDYQWHPTEEEFTSPLTSEQWAELLSDATFNETDAAKAMRCLRDYGEPATFQQLSIRYRGTMGRYRRWLGEAAQRAGERFGVPAPQKDQFGMDEWWPLLYVTRATGKPGAGVFEMQLRPEVEQAFALIVEKERQAKQAENARQLQRIEQLERARREERERRAAEAAKAEQAEKTAPAPAAPAAAAPAPEPEPTATVRTVAQVIGIPDRAPVVEEPEDVLIPSFPALNEFLETMAARKGQGGSRYVASAEAADTLPFDATGPIDYALRYAERLRSILNLIREGAPRVTAAAVARELGDDDVRHLQDILNGQSIPSFAYLSIMQRLFFVNPDYLEAVDGMEEATPAFCTYEECLGLVSEDGRADLSNDVPCQIAYVVDDSAERRTGVLLRFSDVRCVLLTRMPVAAETNRAQNDELDAFVRMVDELDDFARTKGIARTSHTVSAADWEKLATGRIWPGTILR